jgi:hypothetical protein
MHGMMLDPNAHRFESNRDVLPGFLPARRLAEVNDCSIPWEKNRVGISPGLLDAFPHTANCLALRLPRLRIDITAHDFPVNLFLMSVEALVKPCAMFHLV